MLMPYTTTATEFQRNYKKVVNKAKRLKLPVVILSNNQPQGVYIDYDVFVRQNMGRDNSGTFYTVKRKRKSLDQLFGSWTKDEADKFDQVISDAFEQINPEDWR
jgi:hypothetical protein